MFIDVDKEKQIYFSSFLQGRDFQRIMAYWLCTIRNCALSKFLKYCNFYFYYLFFFAKKIMVWSCDFSQKPKEKIKRRANSLSEDKQWRCCWNVQTAEIDKVFQQDKEPTNKLTRGIRTKPPQCRAGSSCKISSLPIEVVNSSLLRCSTAFNNWRGPLWLSPFRDELLLTPCGGGADLTLCLHLCFFSPSVAAASCSSGAEFTSSCATSWRVQ